MSLTEFGKEKKFPLAIGYTNSSLRGSVYLCLIFHNLVYKKNGMWNILLTIAIEYRSFVSMMKILFKI